MTTKDAEDVIRFVEQHYPHLQANRGHEYMGRGWSVVVHNPAGSAHGELEIVDRQTDDDLREALDQFQAS